MDSQTQNPIYKQLSTDMREGLRDIYQQISSASQEEAGLPVHEDSEARALFQEATSQLHEVLKSTEEAANNILEIVERNEANQEEVGHLLALVREGKASEEQIARLETLNHELGDDLMNLTLQLSFQDLTGQRIKKVVSALNKIESKVVNLYVTSGLIMEGAENNPTKNASELKAEAEEAVEAFRKQRQASTLKGPSSDGMNQSSIDGMLAQLGL